MILGDVIFLHQN